MTDPASTAPAEPDGAERSGDRLPILDYLRGVAILLILFMNISEMGGSLYAFFDNDPRRFGWTTPDQAVWWLREVVASNTARCLLELLFGVGMVILTERAAATAAPWRVLRDYAWRNVVLFLFGLVHVFVLLWPGDILHTYGLAALVAMWFRNLRPRLLITIGLVMATLQLVGAGYYVTSAASARDAAQHVEARAARGEPVTPVEQRLLASYRESTARHAAERARMAARVAAENEARTDAPRTWAASLWGAFAYMQRSLLELVFVWETASTMLIGAALYKLGIIQGRRSPRFYARMTAVAYLVGLPLRTWAAYDLTRGSHLPDPSLPFGEYARLLTTLGHIGLLNLLAATAIGARWLKPFAAAGRTALTLYVLQTLATMWVLYPPWGLRLYNQQSWSELMLTALAVNAALLAWAMWWARHFAIAPVEWAWRSLVAGRALAFRRAA